MSALPAKFHSALPEGDSSYESNLFRAKSTLQSLLPIFYGSGISREDKHKLECTFEVLDYETKAYSLKRALELLNYEVKVECYSHGSYQVSVKTTPIQMSEESMTEWVEWMCKIAYCVNGSFRGWSNPNFGF